jgi:hypothetical protein
VKPSPRPAAKTGAQQQQHQQQLVASSKNKTEQPGTINLTQEQLVALINAIKAKEMSKNQGSR